MANTAPSHFCDVSKMVKLPEAENGKTGTRGWREGERGSVEVE